MKKFEKFEEEIKSLDYNFGIDEGDEGIKKCGKELNCRYCIFYKYDGLCNNRKTQWLYEEYTDPILTKQERNYLEAVLKPFKNRVVSIGKFGCETDNDQFIHIEFDIDSLSLPFYSEEAMYDNMQLNKEYTLEELGLFTGETK